MIGRDLAEMYQVETKVLNQAVKRNINRFLKTFRFQLTEEEYENLKSQSLTSSSAHRGRCYLPYVFTDQGLAMLIFKKRVMKNEIILYQTDDLAEHIEVCLEDETVWLSQQQMATLFNQTKQKVSLHINNCYKEDELDRKATGKDSLTVQKEGNRSKCLDFLLLTST